MPSSRRELVVRLYEAWNEEDREWAYQHYAPDVVFDWSRRQLDPAVVSGKDGVAIATEKLVAPWSEHRMELEEVFVHKRYAVAFVRVVGRGGASGVEVDARVAHVWTFRDDGLVERMEYFGERDDALVFVAEAPA